MDDARKWTDAELEALEKRMAKEYRQAADEMKGKQEKWLKKFTKEREQREKALDNTQEAMDAHKRWLQSQTIREQWFSDMVDGLSDSAHRANEKAVGMLNNYIPRVYTENANRAAFAVDKAVRADTRFALVNEDAIRYLMGGMEQGQLLHEVTLTPEQQRLRAGLQSLRKDLDAAKDVRWNRQKFTSAITQGIMQGESIPNIVKRTESIYGQNLNASIRAARTATTSAENAGRMNSFERAQRLGIDMEIVWEAVLDGRTRSSHRALDGERIHTGERFSNGLRWPGDPQGPGHELWNCRCRANGRVVGFDGKRGDWADEAGERWSRLPEGMTYEQWKAAKPVIRAESYLNDWGRVTGDWYTNRAVETFSTAYNNGFSGIVEGQDILGTWQRRPDQYDFEIEDVIAAQGFDGKPRIVHADEFDRAVKAANNGDGLVMQRTYSAPDQETLDAYRDMLYDGKWYVDCSTGGAQYGQGMYAAADYTGKLSEGIKDEMEHYIGIGNASFGAVDEAQVERALVVAKERLYEEIMAGLPKSSREQFPWIDLEKRDWKPGSPFSGQPKGPAYLAVGKYNREAVSLKNKLRNMDSWVIESVYGVPGHNMQAPHYVETMTLDPSAKIITWRDAMKQHESAFDELIERGLSPEQVRSMIPSDVGSFAAASGYDAINATGHGASGSYTVVLNRTKLIIRRPE